MSVAVFIDVENIRYSVINAYSEPEPHWAGIASQCREYGRISSFQAFGDWSKPANQNVHEVQKHGIQPIFVPLSEWNKSSLDCYLTVAAMKLFFQNETIDTLILGSGDRDFIPLVIELKAMGKKVVIMAVGDTLSRDLQGNADDVFLYQPKVNATLQADVKEDGQKFIIDTLESWEKDDDFPLNHGWVNLAALGLRLQRKRPDFAHKNYGYEKLIDMLKEIPRLELKYDDHEQLVARVRIMAEETPEKTSSTTLGSICSVKENGYGFIKPDVGAENIFFHFTKVIGDFNSLRYGDRVSYELYNTDRGPNAEHVQKIDADRSIPASAAK